MYKLFIKRLMDIVISGMGIIILSPLFVILITLIKIKLGSPVIFSQARPGYHEKIFQLKKFRSMTNECDENGNLLPDSVRLTKFGRVLRSTSLDELPELLNIFRGDMSLIGPRPLLVSYIPYYTNREKKRHQVRPGLTGLAQVNGRNYVKWDERLEMDVFYVENLSFRLDVKIFFKTITNVFSRKDVAVDTYPIEGTLIESREENK